MADDLESVIAGAMSDAGLNDGGDDSGSADTSDAGDSGLSTSSDAVDLSTALSADEGTDAGTAAEGDGALGESVAPDAAAAGTAAPE
jgi:hypothetical protein